MLAAEFGGPELDQVKRLKEPEREDARLVLAGPDPTVCARLWRKRPIEFPVGQSVPDLEAQPHLLSHATRQSGGMTC